MRKKRGESDDADSTPVDDVVEAVETADVPVAGHGDEAPGKNDEPFTRYQNSVYRLVSMGGAALVAVIGITGIAIGRTLDPIPPAQFFFIDGIVAVVLFGWYLLGMRCRLDVAETWVHVATKYGDFRVDRDRIESVEPDLSLRGSLQWSGRPLIIRYRSDDSGDKVKSRKAYGCLPNDAQTQQRAVEELQQALGGPDESRLGDLEDAVAERLAGTEFADGQNDLADAVAARLATMKPEGDDPEA
ncbi:MAG TPA: hypothetical protein VFN21_01650 [Acidimicrobiales bacterium]|nr:hypothetical protein [Acidimicrobiales bacterium]